MNHEPWKAGYAYEQEIYPNCKPTNRCTILPLNSSWLSVTQEHVYKQMPRLIAVMIL